MIGLDQEFAFAYIPLLERMYKNLKPARKRELKDAYAQVVNQIKGFYEDDSKKVKNLYIAIYESKEINQYLEAASENNSKNKEIADAIKITTKIYRYNPLQKYYAANSSRIDYMKKNLSNGFARLRFNVRKDKMLLKMGAIHTPRGLSFLDLFEIGNTLSELAIYNGNRSLHITFNQRYSIQDGNEVDALSPSNPRSDRLQALLQMGKKDKWTVIDVRQLREAHFMRKFDFNPIIEQIITGHDLFIITPTDKAKTPNFNVKK